MPLIDVVTPEKANGHRQRRRLRARTLALGAFVGLGILGAVFAAESDGMAPMREMMQSMMADVLPPPGLAPEQLPVPRSHGARLLTRYCTQCHALPGPGMHTAEEWPHVVERMQQRMDMHGRMMGGLDVPTPAALMTIRDYLQTHAQKPLLQSQFSILAEPGGQAFRQICAQCHALPDPRQHSAAEWPAVVIRMQRNMAVMRKPLPDEAMVGQIAEFLARHGHEPE